MGKFTAHLTILRFDVLKNIAKYKYAGMILAVSISTLSVLGLGFLYSQSGNISRPNSGGTPAGMTTLATQEIPPNVAETARNITVRVVSEKAGGDATGVLVLQAGNQYQVLTCQHVIEGQTRFRILTQDGREHPAKLKVGPDLANFDLAILEFTSAADYQVAQLANESTRLTAKQPVYAFGFANYKLENGNPVDSTHGQGWKAFRREAGQVGLILSEPLQGGYQIGISNEIELGMSGGPLLNQAGELVGINGRAKYPLQGSSAYQYANGKIPSSELANQLESLSWAIPITAIPFL